MSEIKKFLDQKGLEYLWSKISMEDYPNNDTLIAVINAIDEGKMDKTTAIPLIEQAIAGQVPVVKSVDENGKPVEWETRNLAPELIVPIIAYPDYGILVSEVNFQQVDDFAFKNGLDNLKASFFIMGNTLETETEHYQPYYYSISCLKVRDITSSQVIAYDFVFLMDDELKTYRLTSTGTTLNSSIKLPLLKSATVGKPLVVKEVDENGKPISWETKEFPDHIRTIEIDDNSVYPGGAANILIYDREKIFTATDLVNLFRTFSMNELPYVFRQVAQPQEDGPTKMPKFMLKKTWTERIDGGYLLHLHFDDSLADILANSADNTISLDPDWVAPTTPSDIPDTTEANKRLVTNSQGQKVWADLPVTETIKISLTDATRILPDVIQYYGTLTPAEIIENARYVNAVNLVFEREIRDHKDGQQGVVVDIVKDRGYNVFRNTEGNRCLRVYFDNYAPIIIDATKENPFYLDPDWIAPEEVALKSELAELQTSLDTLKGTGEGSIKDTVADAVATIVANAPEDFDTLKEIADWIANDETGTFDLIERVGEAEKEIEDLKTKDVQADWAQEDESAFDYIKNKPTAKDALALLMETGFITPAMVDEDEIFVSGNEEIYTL